MEPIHRSPRIEPNDDGTWNVRHYGPSMIDDTEQVPLDTGPFTSVHDAIAFVFADIMEGERA